MSHILREMEHLDDALVMMEFRNEVRDFMTHNTAEIMEEQQVEWYRETYLPARERGELFGYIVRREDEDPIGYGLISKRDGRWWVSGGLTAEARGEGAGYFLFEEMTNMIHEDLRSEDAWLDVLNTNQGAKRLYRKLGYVAVVSGDRITVMLHSRVHEQEEAEAA
jgi:ribosomal protein S18 acetylase RimI-like enzyme